MAEVKPEWVDKELYPFTPKRFETGNGEMSYVDEGEGKPVVMVHGNPVWSFVYRNFIKELSQNYRCIAPDHLGFGLSDKPFDYDYKPEQHAENLENLLNSLDLDNITLVVHDWGGSIGLSYALKYPEKVSKIVLLNTWCWSVKGDKHFEDFSSFMGGPIGRFLIKHFNFFVKVVMNKATINDEVLTKEVMNHYVNALPTPESRKACWVFPKEIIGSSDWLEKLWNDRELLATIPTLIFWGGEDIAFRTQELAKWESLFQYNRTEFYSDCGHYLQEEKYEAMLPIIKDFLAK